MKIANIKLRNFKSIKQMDLDFKDINILIGANGSGKSNFISFFTLLKAILEDRLDYYVTKHGGCANLLYFGRKTSSDLFFEILFSDNRYYSCTLEPAEMGNSFIIKDVLYKNHENNLSSTRKGKDISNRIKKAFTSSRVYHFHDTSSSAKIKQPCNINDNRFLRPDASNLAAFLYFLQKKKKRYFNKIQDTIRLAAPFFAEFNLAPGKLNREEILLEWKHAGSEEYFNAYHLSDGTLRMICLITLLLQPELPEIILIDEPELGLHPYAITIFTSLLKSAGTESQIIVSTQSVTLINNFLPDDIIVVERGENNQSIFKRPDMNSLAVWLEDYSLGEIWEKNIIGGRP